MVLEEGLSKEGTTIKKGQRIGVMNMSDRLFQVQTPCCALTNAIATLKRKKGQKGFSAFPVGKFFILKKKTMSSFKVK